jgi:hypothetical protein
LYGSDPTSGKSPSDNFHKLHQMRIVESNIRGSDTIFMDSRKYFYHPTIRSNSSE